jgi:hypothetical protein
MPIKERYNTYGQSEKCKLNVSLNHNKYFVELQGTAHEALRQLESIETLGLEAPYLDDSNLRYDN